MKVMLIASTPNGDDLAGRAAAICTASTNWESALDHALSAGHESVVEHVSFTFLVWGISRAAMAQLTRHRIASFDVESQRFVNMKDMPVVVPPTIQKTTVLLNEYLSLMDDIKAFYHDAVAAGIPREDARFVTPQAAETKLLLTMNARELRHFFSLRCCNRAQWEIRALADEMLRLCKEKCPRIFADAGPGCVRGHCPEKRPCGSPRVEEANGK